MTINAILFYTIFKKIHKFVRLQSKIATVRLLMENPQCVNQRGELTCSQLCFHIWSNLLFSINEHHL